MRFRSNRHKQIGFVQNTVDMESLLGSSPLDFVRVPRLIATSMDLIEDNNRSQIVRRIHKTILLIWRALFLYPCSILQNAALFAAETHEATMRMSFVALTATKIAIKGTMFLLKIGEIREMWQKLNDPIFRTKTIREMK